MPNINHPQNTQGEGEGGGEARPQTSPGDAGRPQESASCPGDVYFAQSTNYTSPPHPQDAALNADAPPSQPSRPAPKLHAILASASPRRRELLEGAGVAFSVAVPREPVDETLEPDDIAMPAQAAKKLAEKKAGAVVQELLAGDPPPDLYAVIGADTMVVCDGKIFGKPKNLDDAKAMLRALSGRTHEVVTGVAIFGVVVAADGNVSLFVRSFAEASEVEFKELTDAQIADYLRCGESFDKAGAYAIQGAGANLVSRTKGSLNNIIGLPTERLLEVLPDLKSAI